MATFLFISVFDAVMFLLWHKLLGRFCAQHPLVLFLPPCPDSSSVQRQHGHLDIASTRLPLHDTLAAHLYQCGAWDRTETQHGQKKKKTIQSAMVEILGGIVQVWSSANNSRKWRKKKHNEDLKMCAHAVPCKDTVFFNYTCSPCSLTGICAMHIAQLPQTEAVSSGWIHIAVYSYQRAVSQDLKHLPHLDIHLKVWDWAPELWTLRYTWGRKKKKNILTKFR